MRLYTFRISHFSEKARWALDRAGVAYDEIPLLPGPHVITMKRLAKRTSVPLWIEAGKQLQGSGAIVDRADELSEGALTPVDAEQAKLARAIERQADLAFGRGTQQILYAILFDYPELLTRAWAQKGPFWAPWFYRAANKPIVQSVRSLYRITDQSVAEARERFRSALDELDAQLQKGSGEYLVGDRFSRADVAVAALLAPTCRPPEHSFEWFEPPPEYSAFASEHEGRPTFEHVRRLYREERHRRVANQN